MTSSVAASSDTPHAGPARRYDPRTVTHWGDTMRRRTLLIIAAAVVIAIAVTTTVLWMNGKSYDDMVKDCQKALTSSASKTHRPAACKGLKQDDYDTLLVAWTLKHALDDMPKDQRDELDYYDDGSINGSIG